MSAKRSWCTLPMLGWYLLLNAKTSTAQMVNVLSVKQKFVNSWDLHPGLTAMPLCQATLQLWYLAEEKAEELVYWPDSGELLWHPINPLPNEHEYDSDEDADEEED